MLTIQIKSFSYKKGIPTEENPHGGGFVFDCRGIDNPGLIESLSLQTGLDKDIQNYLEDETEMPKFIELAFEMIDISVKSYLKRDYDSLSIYFGCTGRHRSVFAAEKMAEMLREEFNQKVKVCTEHTNLERM